MPIFLYNIHSLLYLPNHNRSCNFLYKFVKLKDNVHVFLKTAKIYTRHFLPGQNFANPQKHPYSGTRQIALSQKILYSILYSPGIYYISLSYYTLVAQLYIKKLRKQIQIKIRKQNKLLL